MLAVGGVRQIDLLRNSKNCTRKFFFYSYVDPIHSQQLTWQLNKEDLDLCTLSFSWCLCPGEYGRENGMLHFLHTRGTIYCWETGVHTSAFNKILRQLKLH
jgi:hypothetical protein